MSRSTYPPPKELRILYQRSGNLCAKCKKELTVEEDLASNPLAISQVAHIVGQSSTGPRGDYPYDRDKIDLYENLVLLCEECHAIVDKAPQTYTVERLRRMKEEHERKIKEATGRIQQEASTGERRYKSETLYSTLLPVTRMPKFVFYAPCLLSDADEKSIKIRTEGRDQRNIVTPFLVRNKQLICFNDLAAEGNPFREYIANGKIERILSSDWWQDPDRMRWYMTLLSRSLNKLTGRKGLNLDKEHQRYYFQPQEPGKPTEIRYRPLNQKTTTTHVVWQPITKKTGIPKKFWYHRAVSLSFHYLGEEKWCLSIRPEYHVTKDGQTPLPSEQVGPKVTKKKSRTHNFDLLGEVQFWRDFLSEASPSIMLNFGNNQAISISSTPMKLDIEWPGMPEEHQMVFKNVEFEEDLFSYIKRKSMDFESGGLEEDDEEWNEEVEEN